MEQYIMATLAFSLAGQFVGGAIGGPIGATIGRALGAIAGSAVDNALFGETSEQKIGPDIRLQNSSEGAPIAKIYGWNRVSGNIIWATELERIVGQSSGAKGTSPSAKKEDLIVANCAVSFCEGEVSYLGNIWADGELLDTNGLNIRFYRGTNSQLPDSLITAKQGANKTPAYRNICYIVFERLPLEQFGNRIPNISVELCRSVGDLEQSIRAITVIPGATEFGYDPVPRVQIISPGKVVSENAHVVGQTSNWTISIDELVALCPNLEHVALIVSWFGDDLRCGSCKIQPRVESSNRNIKNTTWRVNGLSRQQVPTVTYINNAPAYGGTPSDNSVLAAIADLKSRGLKVTLYPLMMMDISSNNSLTDPYTQNIGQSAYPWRGRITCNPAIGVAGSPDKSAAIIPQINAFNGNANVAHFSASGQTVNYSGPTDWGYRRMILHYAKLMQLAGGVNAFIIGSEMKQMSFLRSSQEQFPFVDDLVNLAADVKSIVGANTKVTYAADWSEYSGYQPSDGTGDKYFHLDPVWASPNIDAIGIDNYMPISDWRDGNAHADAQIASSPYELDYLKSNIAGGEGYDFYYASSADREAGNRSPISDGAYNEPWIWRYKDLYNWWSNAHHNRIGGVRSALPSAWIPQSKPFWLTELGCGAVDKGSNRPNAFADPKSVENALPYFSSGAPDPIQQRQHLRAYHSYWQPSSPDFDIDNNPISSVYGANMLDPDRIYIWTWDARPFPAFPKFLNIWSDGNNYKTGHWLTGRLGAMGAAELIKAMAKDYNVDITDIIDGDVFIEGAQIANITSLRNAISSILDAASLEIFDKETGLKVSRISNLIAANISGNNLAQNEGEIISRKQPDSSQIIGQLALTHYERQYAYSSSTISAISLKGEAIASLNSGLVMSSANTSKAAQNALTRLNVSDDIVEFALPNSFLALEVGDIVEIEGQANGPFVINEIRDGNMRKISARATFFQPAYTNSETEISTNFSAIPIVGEPLVIAAHLPSKSSENSISRLLFGALSDPWTGDIIIKEQDTDIELARLTNSATIGVVSETIFASGSSLWDNAASLKIELYSGHLSSASEISVMANNNRLAVERDDGTWEIIGFVEAELVSSNNYTLTKLLRGLGGTDSSNSSISAGNQVILLDQNVLFVDVTPDMLGTNIVATAFAGANDAQGVELNIDINLDPAKPLNPVHLSAKRDAQNDDVNISWVRRTRLNGDSWALSEVPLELVPENYQIDIYDGANIVRSLESSSSSFIYSSANQIVDFGLLPNNFNFEVAQISATLGAGHFADGAFSS